MRCGLAVQGRMPEGSRVDGVQGSAQIEMEVLGRAAADAVHADGGHRGGHERHADARTEPVDGGHNGILACEGHGATCACSVQAKTGKQRVERCERVERAVLTPLGVGMEDAHCVRPPAGVEK